MTTFPGSPKIDKGGIVLVDPRNGKTLSLISLQYNPDSLTRSFEPKAFGGGNQFDSQRFSGPAVETITIDAEIDAADQLEFPDEHQDTIENGIQPQLAALESLINPTSEQLNRNNILASAGTLEIAPMEAPLVLFIWSRNRILPVNIATLSFTEEAFDAQLNPIRATINLKMTVLTVTELGFDHKGGSLFMNYLQNKERLASKSTGASLDDFGISSLPL